MLQPKVYFLLVICSIEIYSFHPPSLSPLVTTDLLSDSMSLFSLILFVQFTSHSDEKFSLPGEFPKTDSNNYRFSENSGKAGLGFGA